VLCDGCWEGRKGLAGVEEGGEGVGRAEQSIGYGSRDHKAESTAKIQTSPLSLSLPHHASLQPQEVCPHRRQQQREKAGLASSSKCVSVSFTV
jgi:hypothetical protein